MPEKEEEFEPAFARLIQRVKADPIKEKLAECGILTRELFLLEEADMKADKEDNPWKPLRRFVLLLMRNLGTYTALEEAGVTFPNEAADVVCETWPTLAALTNSDWKEVDSALKSAKASASLTKCVTKLHGGKAATESEPEKKKGDVNKEYNAEKAKELKEKREAAKEAIEAHKKRLVDMKAELAKLPGTDAASRLKTMKEKFPAEMKALTDRGVMDDGTKLDALLQAEMKRLDDSMADFAGSAAPQMEDIAAKIDGGNLLRGFYLAKNGIRRGEALLLAHDKNACTAHNPTEPSEMKIVFFTSREDHDTFNSTSNAAGWSAAAEVSARYGMVSGGAAVSKQHKDSSTTVDVQQTRTKTIVVSRQIFLPTMCLNFDRSAMRLSDSALMQLKQVEDRRSARKFLRTFGSHVLTGEVTVGGRMEYLFKSESEEEATVHEFLCAESDEFASSAELEVGGVVGSLAAKASYGDSDSKEDAERIKTFKSKCTTTTKVTTWGPPVSNVGVFVKIVDAHTRYWFILNRGSPQAHLAVWDIARQSLNLKDNEDLQRRVKMLEDTWRQDTGPDGDPLLWAPSPSNPEGLLDELIETLLYVCRAGAWLQSLSACVVAFCTNVKRGVDHFKNADFLVDAMTSITGSDNDVQAFFKAVADSFDAQSKSLLLDLFFGNHDAARAIQKSFESRRHILKALKYQLQDKRAEPAKEVPCTPAALEEAVAHHDQDRFSTILAAACLGDDEEFREKAKAIVKDLRGLWTQESLFKDDIVQLEQWEVIDLVVDRVLHPRTRAPSEPEVDDKKLDEFSLAPASVKADKKSLSSLLVDRLIPPSSEPSSHTLCLLDALRHRMDFPKLTQPKSSAAEPGEAEDDDFFDDDDSEAVTESVSLQSTLLKLLDEHDIPAQRELYRLLLSRRSAVPFVTPVPGKEGKKDIHACRLEQLRLVEVEGLHGALIDLATSTLPRVLVCSTLSKSKSKTHALVKNVFGVNSLQCEDRAAGVVFPEEFVVEVGLGFVRTEAKEAKEASSHPCIVLHAMVTSCGASSVLSGPVEKLLTLADMTLIEAPQSEHKELLQVHQKANHRVVLYCEGEPGQKKHQDVEVYSLRCQLDQLKAKVSALAPPQLLQPDAPQRASLYQASQMIRDLQIQRPASATFAKLMDRLNRLAIDPLHLRNNVYRSQDVFAEENKLKQKLKEAKLAREEAKAQVLEQRIEAKNKERRRCIHVAAQDRLLMLFMDILRVASTEERVLLLMELERKFHEANVKVMRDLFQGKNNLSADQQLALKAELSQHSVQFEHLWRELSHLCLSSDKFSMLADAAAQHLLDGFTVELMDGQSDVVNQPWIMLVIQALDRRLPSLSSNPDSRNRFCVHSTCGIQSSGKSTMLNITYGARLRTSVGQCTLGVNMMLIRAENRAGYDYVLLLDTEGVRSPEHKGKKEYFVRDNKMVALATLPAHMTTVMFPGEDDSMICEVLPIVMLAARASQLSDTVNNGFGTQMFFLYRGIDVNNKGKLINIMSSLKTELEKAQALVLTGEEKAALDGKTELIFDIRMLPNEPDKSDVRAMGINKVSTLPPDDHLVASYGADVMKMREYMHKRITEKKHFSGPNADQLLAKLNLVFTSIGDSDWFLSFQTIRDRFTHASLMNKLQSYKRDLSLACAEAFNTIKEEVVKAETKDSLSADTYVKKFQDLVAKVEQDTTKQVEGLFESGQDLYAKWKEVSLQDWKLFVDSQRSVLAQQVKTFVEVKTSFPMMVEQELTSMRNAIRAKKGQVEFDDLWMKSQLSLLARYPSMKLKLRDKISSALADLRRLATTGFDEYQQVFTAQWQVDIRANQAMVLDLVKASKEAGLIRKLFNAIQSRISGSDPERALVHEVFEVLTNACPLDKLVRSGYQEHVVIPIKQELPSFDKLPAKVRTIIYLTVEHFLLQVMTEAQQQYESVNYPAAMMALRQEEMREFCERVRKGMSASEDFKQQFKTWISNNIEQASLEHVTENLLPWLVKNEVAKNMTNSECLSMLDADLLMLSDASSVGKLFQFLKRPSQHVEDILERAAWQVLSQKSDGDFGAIKEDLASTIRQAGNAAVRIEREDETKDLLDEHMKSGSQAFMDSFVNKLSLLKKYLAVRVPKDLRVLDIPKAEFKDITDELCRYVKELPKWRFPSAATIASELTKQLCTGATQVLHPPLCSVGCPHCYAPCMHNKGHSGQHRAVHQPRGLCGTGWSMDSSEHLRNVLVKESCIALLEQKCTFSYGSKDIPYSDFSKEYRDWTLDLPQGSDCQRSLSVREFLFARHQDYIVSTHSTLKNHDVSSFQNDGVVASLRAARASHVAMLRDLQKVDAAQIEKSLHQ